MMVGDTVEGIGVLVVDGERYGGFRYLVEAQPAGRSRGRLVGRLTGPSELRAFIFSCFGKEATLELENGEMLSIVPSHMRLPSDPPSFDFVAAMPAQ